MADHIQLDGKTFVPLAEAAAMTKQPEARVRSLAADGKVFLRAIGKKIYVDLEGLRAALQPKPVRVAMPAPIPQRKAAPRSIAQAAPVQAPNPRPMASAVVASPVPVVRLIPATPPEPVVQSAPVAAPVSVAEPQDPITLSASLSPLDAAISAIPQGATLVPAVLVPSSQAVLSELPSSGNNEVPSMTLPPRPIPRMLAPESNARSASPVGNVVVAVALVGAIGMLTYLGVPTVARWASTVGSQLAAALGGGSAPSASQYEPTPNAVGNVPLQYSPSELQASGNAATLPYSGTTTKPIYYVYNYPVIERVREELRTIQASDPAGFQAELDALYKKIQLEMRGLSVNTNTQFAQQYQVIAHTNKIDNLGSVTIVDSIFQGGTIRGARLEDVSLGADNITGVLAVGTGGTGTSTAPTYGQILLGNSAGGYDLAATSTLGLASAIAGTAGQISYYETTGNTLAATSSLFISSTGNIGIGTTNPGVKFAISGGNASILGGIIMLQVGSAGSPSYNFTSDGTTASNTGIFSPSSGLGFSTAGSERMRIDASGNVGIGTTTPQQKLSISSSGSTVLNLDSTGGGGAAMQFSLDGVSKGYWGFTTTGDDGLAYTSADGNNIRMLITDFGNIGIGTTSPFRTFSVASAVATAQVAVSYDTTRNTDILTDSAGDFNLNPSGDDVRLSDDNLWVCAGGACPSGTPSGNGNLIVESRLGVGTSAPGRKFETLSADEQVARFTSSNGSHYGFLEVENDQGNRVEFGIDPNEVGSFYNRETSIGANSPVWQFSDPDFDISMTILRNGKVGIGTTTPTDQLSVQGLLRVGANSNSPVTLGTATSTFNGDIRILGKLDVGTIDPIYTIDGIKYATYGHSTVGVKEEVVFKFRMDAWDQKSGLYKHVITFDELERGSDLWLFYQVTDFGADWNNLVVSLTTAFNGFAFYEEDPAARTLTIFASQAGDVSARLIANRHDFSKWGNVRPDQDDDFTHFELESK